MRAVRVDSIEFHERFETLRQLARTEPVVITQHGADDLVVLSSQEWERLKRRDRKVGLTVDLSDEWLHAVETAEVPAECSHLDRLLD